MRKEWQREWSLQRGFLDEKGMAKGMELAKRIFALNAQGLPAEEIARECGVTTEQVKELIS